ncbi:MAG TPA: ribosome biogenesis GTPase Der [Candidatus Aquilonibacter sp.]|nr:ribosome biogenesis GTPase Der [Candidatus Aquilonibacter sp.]
MAPRRDQKKRMGKKHRQASTRPRLGKAPRTGAQMANVAPKKRKALSSKKAAAAKAARTPKRSPERERSVVLDGDRRRAGEKNIPFKGDRKARGERGLEIGGEADARAAELAVATSGTATEDVPLVAICGRPNVGKSTLFNRITGTRRSIVGDEPGITRDRIYGETEWAGRTVRIVDTGGVVPDDQALIPAEILRQARVALDEADAIVMVVDGRTELAAPDVELARLLIRNAGARPLFLAVNKMDSADLEAGAENFRTLGFRHVLPISAEHGIGVADLLDEVWAALPAETVAEEPTENMEGIEEEAEEDEGDFIADEDARAADSGETRARRLRSHGEHVQRETKIAIIGRPNVGKSTLLNALTGTERAIVSPIAGTTRDAVDEVVKRDGHSFRFIDTAGIRRKGKTKLMAEKLSVVMSRKHLEAADVALLMIDATEGVTGSDATIGGYAHESGRSVIIVINKWDLMTEVGPDGKRLFDGKAPADKKVYEQQVRDALKYLDYAPVLFVSAAEKKGVEEIFKKVELVARERRKRISTGAMNRFLEQIDFQRASVPMNRRVKVYYMTQAAVAPPTFVLFTDRDVKLHFSYERFLANEIRAAFKFIGSPIWFKVRARNKRKSE